MRRALQNCSVTYDSQIDEIIKKYTILFSKSKVDEISKFFRNPLSCIVVAPDSRRYSCTLSEFKEMLYDELVNLKTGYADFMKNRQGTKVYS